jgi:hypothetical protein
MTLLELLVVVAILAVLATVAIQSTTEIGDQTRYEATQRTVSSFRAAVLGPEGQMSPDGSPVLTGFLSDMGRLPLSVSITSPDLNAQGALLELYSETLPAGLSAYAVRTVSPSTTTPLMVGVTSINTNEVYGSLSAGFVRVPAGWRGPYIRKPSSRYTMVDGWDKPMVSRWDLGIANEEVAVWPTMLLEYRTNLASFGYGSDQLYTPVLSANREVSGVVTSSGFEGAPTASGVYTGTFDSTISRTEVQNDLIVQVSTPPGKYSTTNSFNLLLMAYGPNPNVATDGKPLQVYAQQVVFAASTTQITLSGALAPTVGTRVFRAVLRTNSAATYSAANYARSAPLTVPVTRFTQSVNLLIP